MPAAIADASVLIHLSRVGRFDLLPSLFERVVVPSAVWREVVERGESRPGGEEVRSGREAGWVQVEDPTNTDLVRLLRQSLGAGESEALALAVEAAGEGSDAHLLVDEADARRIAEAYDLPKTGTVGILVRAKLEGEVERLTPLLRALREEAGFWMAEELENRALRAVGEDPSKDEDLSKD